MASRPGSGSAPGSGRVDGGRGPGRDGSAGLGFAGTCAPGAGSGLAGASGGGYATVRAMAEFGDLYRAGVAMCGNHDQSSYVAGWGDCYQGLYGQAAYATQASHTVAGRITGRLLLIHGEMDDNVHPVHTLRVVDALLKAGRDFEMLIVPDAGHMLIKLPAVQQRVWRHLQRHLQPNDER